MFDESKAIVDNIRAKRINYIITRVKLKKSNDIFYFLDESDNVINHTTNLNVVNEVVKKLLDLDYFIYFS